MLIAICGIDGAGKTTLLNGLSKRLEEKNEVFVTKQPTQWYRKDERVRSMLNEESTDTPLMLREMALLAASDRLRHLRTEIFPQLKKGWIVITDRYVFSTYAYFMARGLQDLQWLKEINKNVPMPDFTFFIDVPAAEALKRIKKRDGKFKKREEANLGKMEKVRDIFIQQPWGKVDNYFIIDGLESAAENETKIMNLIRAEMGEDY